MKEGWYRGMGTRANAIRHYAKSGKILCNDTLIPNERTYRSKTFKKCKNCLDRLDFLTREPDTFCLICGVPFKRYYRSTVTCSQSCYDSLRATKRHIKSNPRMLHHDKSLRPVMIRMQNRETARRASYRKMLQELWA